MSKLKHTTMKTISYHFCPARSKPQPDNRPAKSGSQGQAAAAVSLVIR